MIIPRTELSIILCSNHLSQEVRHAFLFQVNFLFEIREFGQLFELFLNDEPLQVQFYSFASSVIASCIKDSFTGSTLLVISSRIKIGASFRKALAIDILCLCPPDKILHFRQYQFHNLLVSS